MKALASVIAYAVVSLLLATNALAAGRPIVFVHGHGDDGWIVWERIRAKLPPASSFRVPTGEFVQCAPTGIPPDFEHPACAAIPSSPLVPADSYWFFDYYRHFAGGQVTRPPGKIGNPKDAANALVLRDPLPGEQAIWGNSQTYNTSRSYAADLGSAIDNILTATGASQVDMVVYSMGGLVARAYLKWYDGATKVRKILFVATPNRGLSDVAEHVAQYGLEVTLSGFVIDGKMPDGPTQRIGEDLEMYPKIVDAFTFKNETAPPPSILPKQGPLPSFQDKSWLEWLNMSPVVPPPVEYATIAGWYRDELVRLTSGYVNPNLYGLGCIGFHQSCCVGAFGACFISPGPCDCCGITTPACKSAWDIISDMLQKRQIPDDGVVNVQDVALGGAAFNDIDFAYHAHVNVAPFDQIPENNIITECNRTAQRITTWILQDQGGLYDYTSPNVKTPSSTTQGGDSWPPYSVQAWPPLPAINPDVSKQRLASLQHTPHQGLPSLKFVPPGFSFDVKQLIPDQGPAGAPVFEATPAFFLQPMQSNAVEVYAVDYVRPSDSAPLGGILIELTEGKLYSHDFATCARYAGYLLDSITSVQVDDGWYYQAALSKPGESMYAVSMHLLLDAVSGSTIDSAWIGDDVPVPEGRPVLNIQVWTVAPADTSALVSQVVARAKALISSLTPSNGAPKEVPRVHFRAASTNPHDILVDVYKSCAIEQVKLEQVLYPEPDATTSYSVAVSFWLPPGERSLRIGQSDIDSAVIYVRTTGSLGDGPRDKIYVNKTKDPCAMDPEAWWSYNDVASGGTSTATVMVPATSAPSNPDKANVLFEIPSSAHMEGVVTTTFAYGFVGMGIQLSSCQQYVDMTGAAAVSVMIRGDGGAYRLRLETASVLDYDYHGIVFAAPTSWSVLTFPISAFSQEGWGHPVPWTGSDVMRISFQTVGQPLSSISLDVSDIVISRAGGEPSGPLQVYGMVPYWCFNDRACDLLFVGDHLDQAVQVSLGGQTLATSQLSASHLSVSVPSGLAPGMYDVTVLPSNGPAYDLGSILRIEEGALAAMLSCQAESQCQSDGACDTATGLCKRSNKADGSACDDGDACTVNETCQAGVCSGGIPVVCMAQDQCHDIGVCDSLTGVCSNPTKADGIACDDGDVCTQADTCQNGVCDGAPVVCPLVDQCQEPSTCDPSTGQCFTVTKADGSLCSGGTCQSGECTPATIASAGGAGGAAFGNSSSSDAASGASSWGGANGDNMALSARERSVPSAGCGCFAAGREMPAGGSLVTLALALARLRRRHADGSFRIGHGTPTGSPGRSRSTAQRHPGAA